MGLHRRVLLAVLALLLVSVLADADTGAGARSASKSRKRKKAKPTQASTVDATGATTDAQDDGMGGIVEQAKAMQREKMADQFSEEFGVHPDEDENVGGFFEELMEKHMPKDIVDGSRVKKMLESFDDMTDEEAWEEVKTFSKEEEWKPYN